MAETNSLSLGGKALAADCLYNLPGPLPSTPICGGSDLSQLPLLGNAARTCHDFQRHLLLASP
jgi:hypothetical protein